MESLLYPIAAIGLAALILVAIKSKLAERIGGGPETDTGEADDGPLPYRRVDSLLTRGERAFFDVLLSVIPPTQTLFAKVRLLDLLIVPRGTSKYMSHVGRVQSKHVDFVLCDSDTLAPRLVIELDDASHRGAKRAARDAFLDRALRTAGIPILRITARSAYQAQPLREEVERALGSAVPVDAVS